MLPHNSFCSHNRTAGSQILHIKVSRMTTLTQKYSKVGRSFYCRHPAEVLALHTAFDSCRNRCEVFQSVLIPYMSIFFGSRPQFPSSTPHMQKPNKQQDPFPSLGECGRESLHGKRSHCSPHLPIKIRQASKCTAQCWEMSKYVQGLVPLWHIPDDKRETAHTQLSPSLEKQGKFPHPQPKGKFLLSILPA